MTLPTEQITLIIAAIAAFIYAMSYAVRTTADVSSKRAEKDRLAAEVSANLATAVADQLKGLAEEVKRLTSKLDTTEGKLDDANKKIDAIQNELVKQRTESKDDADGLLKRIDDLRAALIKDGSRETLDAALEKDDQAK